MRLLVPVDTGASPRRHAALAANTSLPQVIGATAINAVQFGSLVFPELLQVKSHARREKLACIKVMMLFCSHVRKAASDHQTRADQRHTTTEGNADGRKARRDETTEAIRSCTHHAQCRPINRATGGWYEELSGYSKAY